LPESEELQNDADNFFKDAILYMGLLVNPFSAGTAFMLMQTGWIQASRRVTRRLA